MENESSVKGQSPFVKNLESIQNISELVASALWLITSALTIILTSEIYRQLFEIASIILLGVSVFNILTMISFVISRQRTFSVTRFAARIAFGALAVIGLALSLFALGIKIR